MSEITITASGEVSCGKSAILGEIEILCKALGIPVRYENEAATQSEKNMTHADWTGALELYKPSVVLVESLTRELAAKDAEIAGLRAACEAYEEVNALLLKTWSDTQIDCLGSDAIEHAIITTLKNLGMAEVYAKNRQQ